MKKFYGWSRWYLNRGLSEFEYVPSLSAHILFFSLRGFEMHRFVLREDLHIRSRLFIICNGSWVTSDPSYQEEMLLGPNGCVDNGTPSKAKSVFVPTAKTDQLTGVWLLKCIHYTFSERYMLRPRRKMRVQVILHDRTRDMAVFVGHVQAVSKYLISYDIQNTARYFHLNRARSDPKVRHGCWIRFPSGLK
ncbi:hypothetical protein YC2023_016190 [Brassica napus]